MIGRLGQGTKRLVGHQITFGVRCVIAQRQILRLAAYAASRNICVGRSLLIKERACALAPIFEVNATPSRDQACAATNASVRLADLSGLAPQEFGQRPRQVPRQSHRGLPPHECLCSGRSRQDY